MEYIICKYCKERVMWVGPKPRQFCNKAKCRKRASRENIAERQHQEQERQLARLRTCWRRLPPQVAELLETLLTQHGLEASILATEAIELQSSIIRQRYENEIKKGSHERS